MGKEKLAGWIVRLRYPLLILVLLAAVWAAPNIAKTRINYSLTDYLNENTLTKRGLDIMNREFGATSGMTVALRGEAGKGEALESFLTFAQALPGMMSAEKSGTAREGDDTYTQVSMIVAEAEAEAAYDQVEQYLADVPHLSSGAVRDSRIIQASLAEEIPLVMAVSCLIVLAVLLMMTRSFLEPLIFLAVIAVSIVLNMGTNLIFPSISFITFAVAAILQLALSMDYSIMLINAYDARLDQGLPPVRAMTGALADSFMPVASSALTTVAGMVSLVFMSFTIGYDIGVVLAKGIVLSMLAVFLMMPGLLVLLTPALARTRHKSLRIRAEALIRLPGKVRTLISLTLLILIVAGAVVQSKNVYTYTVRDMDSDSARIAAMFGRSNQTVLLVPACREDKDYERLKETLDRIGRVENGGKPVVRSVYAMPVTGEAALRYYDAESLSELLGVPRESAAAVLKVLGVTPPIRGDQLIERALNADSLVSLLIPASVRSRLTEADRLLTLARETFDGENWSRAILEMDISYTDPGAPEALHEIQRLMAEAYGDQWAMAGNLTATDDIATSFSGDVRKVSWITILAVFLIVMFSFRSLWVPLILVCVIQGAVWINMAFSGLADGSVFFMCYLICMALQMGATIDYGILMTSHYRECRRSLPPLEAAGEALRRSVQTIFTSGLALITAGFAVGRISTVFYISEIGKMLGRGAIVSVLLILLLLPQLLVWLDRRVVSGRFSAENAKPGDDG